MSRVGRSPITIPGGIQVEKKDNHVVVTGQKGTLQEAIHPEINVIIEGAEVRVERPDDSRFFKPSTIS